MQQNGQEQPARQTERESEPNIASAPTEVERQLTIEQQQADECLDLLRRTQADFLNYRRRASQEQTEGRIVAQIALLSQLLPALDDLGRALGTAPSELVTHAWVQGLMLVARRLTTQLNQLGVRQIGAPGEPFNPHWHEAIATEERADMPEGTILQVTRPGYALRDRIIRPAQVVVARAPSPVSQVQGHQGDAPTG